MGYCDKHTNTKIQDKNHPPKIPHIFLGCICNIIPTRETIYSPIIQLLQKSTKLLLINHMETF